MTTPSGPSWNRIWQVALGLGIPAITVAMLLVEILTGVRSSIDMLVVKTTSIEIKQNAQDVKLDTVTQRQHDFAMRFEFELQELRNESIHNKKK